MKIRAVLFDLGETLIKYDYDSPGEVFQKILTAIGVFRPLEEIEDAFRNAQREAENLDMRSSFGTISCAKYWNRWDSLVLKHLGIPNHAELGKIVQSRWFDFIDSAPYPEVERVFADLKRIGLKLGLISSGYEAEILRILQMANIEEKIFDVIVGVDTVKKAKPDPDVYWYALRILKVKPEEALYIGDRVDIDYNGARAVGMNALLIQRKNGAPGDFIHSNRIRSLGEILKFID